ncbi:MAG: prepilin peptidase [Planctomycetota bacterium]
MPRRLYRIPLTLLVVLATLTAVACCYVFGMAHLQAPRHPLYEASDLYVPRLVDAFVVLWCLWVGSSIGSFLNVVAWRMPRGNSIRGRSHCPRCQSVLSLNDNFPVFGWLMLGGRCRACGVRISSRYPIVEASVGVSLTLVAVLELYELSLPRQNVLSYGGPLWAPVLSAPMLITLLYHVVGVALSWTLGLVRMDGHRIPQNLVVFTGAAIGIPMLVYPTLMIVPWQMQVDDSWNPRGLYVDSIVRILTALAAATVLARFLSRGLCPQADPKLDPLGKSTARLMDLIVILAVPTVLVGWQAAPALVVLASMIAYFLRRFLPSNCDSLGAFAIAMPVSLTFQLSLWRWLHAGAIASETNGSFWPSDNGSPWVVLGWCAVLLFVPLWMNDRVRAEEGDPGYGREKEIGASD